MLVIGEIVGAHGIRGEVRVYPHTDFPRRFLDMKEVTLQKGTSLSNRKVQSVRMHKNLVVMALDGTSSRNDAEALRGSTIVVEYSQAVVLPPGQWYIFQLVGCDVIDADSGTVLGQISNILSLPANDVFEMEANGKKYLIPALKEVVLDIDPDRKQIVVRLWEGMME